MNSLYSQCADLKASSKKLALISSAKRNQILLSMSRIIAENMQTILLANKLDVANGEQQGLDGAMLERLRIEEDNISQMQQALIAVAALGDPLISNNQPELRPSGIKVMKKRIPLGVILMIYESRPNVTVEAASLAIKSGNGIILRGGKEALNSNLAIADCWSLALKENELDEKLVTVINTSERRIVDKLLKFDELIDVVVPRGGESLIRHVVANSYIPVIKHYKGVCHLFVDEFADFDTALSLLINGKTQRPGVCNALEGLIVHKSIAKDFLPLVQTRMQEFGVSLCGCNQTRKILSTIEPAGELEFSAEFLKLKISIKLVDDIAQAIEFIDQYGSNHTEVIVTQNSENAEKFIEQVDASVVMVNASSRFSDGGELGLGAEIGISTSKLHAYGPMGLHSLTSEKFVVIGEGQVR